MTADISGKTLALFSALCWAVAIIYFKRAGDRYSPLLLNFFKTFLALLLLLPFFFSGLVAIRPVGLHGGDWLRIAVSGVLGVTVADSLFFVCINIAGAGAGAIANCLYSPLVMLLAWLALSERIGPKGIAGALLVLAAVLMVTLKKGSDALSLRRVLLGMLAGFLAMFFVAAGIVIMKPVLPRADVVWVTELRLLAAFLAFLPPLLLLPAMRGRWRELTGRRAWHSAIPGSLLGFGSMVAWIAAFKLTNVNAAAILNQTNAIFVVILASVWLKEPFTRHRLLATLLAVAGSVLVLLP